MTTTHVPIAITQGRMRVLDNLECETGKTGSRASTFICLIESSIILFILSLVPVSPRAKASISRMVLNDNRYLVERYSQITTHARKAVIAVNALVGFFSEKDASWTVNVAERATTSES